MSIEEEVNQAIAHDVTVHGDNAYQMWKIENSAYEDEDGGMHDAGVNIEIINAINRGCFVERKQSAALPFDLERAKNGEVVQAFYNNSWSDCDIANIFENGDVEIFINNKSVSIDADDLRMKFPPKLEKQQ